MQSIIVAALVIFTTTAGWAQSSGETPRVDPANPSGNQMQPQGWTGPINTQSGGAPASSPQGQTPPGMQSAPEGSNKTVETKEGGVPVESPGTFPVETSGTSPVESSGPSKN